MLIRIQLVLILLISAMLVTPAMARQSPVKIDPSKLLVRPKSHLSQPKLMQDPVGWIQQKQRLFYEAMAKALEKIRTGDTIAAGWTLMLMSFIYGVLHAAGPGHGKAVVSAWLLANEQQLRRGILIAAMAAVVQAITAVILVSVVLLLVQGAGSMARLAAASLESISYAMIGLVGVYLIWTAIKPKIKKTPDHNHHHHHEHGENCDCGHAHMPDARELDNDWSLKKAMTLAFAVGIRPCSGAILVLLLSSSVGLYWAGVASTFAMALGTGITVSFVAFLAVTSRKMALRFTGENSVLLPKLVFAVRITAGIFIAVMGAVLFWLSLPQSIG